MKSPEDAARWIMQIGYLAVDNYYEEDVKDAITLVLEQREQAVQEYKEKLLKVLDSQTHTSELGDSFRFIRKLIGELE